jgi:hypothetical protein
VRNLVRGRFLRFAWWTRTALAAALITLASSTLAAPALAQLGSRSSEAERLFREGRALVDKGDFANACPKFAESEKLDPAPGTLLSLADCEEREKHLIKAKEHYTLAASGFPKNDPRRAFATGRAQAIEKRLAHPTFRLAADAPVDAAVTINDAPLARSDLGVATTMDPGEVRVKVTAPGRQEKLAVVTLGEGESKTIEVEVGAPVPVTPTKPVEANASLTTQAPSSRTDIKRTVAFVSLGVGGASLIVGGVTAVLAASKASTVKDHCDENYLCDSEGVSAASSGRLFAPLSTVTLIAGVVLVGAGTYLYLTSGKRAQSQQKASALMQALSLGGTF